MRGFGDISRSAIVLSVRRCHTATRDTVGTGAATWFLRFSWCVLGYSIAAIIFGAFVRATGSGAGCGSHWPLCNGAIVPHTARMETLIEFTHRVTSVLSLFLVVALACWAWRLYPSGFRIRRSAGTALILILIEAGIGAWLVLSGLMKGNDSVARAVSTMGHLVNTYFLLAALALTSWWAGNEDSAAVPGPRGRIWPGARLGRDPAAERERRHRSTGRYAVSSSEFAGGIATGILHGQSLSGSAPCSSSLHRSGPQRLSRFPMLVAHEKGSSRRHTTAGRHPLDLALPSTGIRSVECCPAGAGLAPVDPSAVFGADLGDAGVIECQSPGRTESGTYMSAVAPRVLRTRMTRRGNLDCNEGAGRFTIELSKRLILAMSSLSMSGGTLAMPCRTEVP